ncbi:MAG: hypothetical protein MKZ58_05495 [Candidatus Poseidoniaceae archaeon]|nr:hypothetical protein [Candidatus Poseidoniaceae archaeon]
MTDEVEQEASSDSDEESVPELTIEERKEALKKARWNVFMYLGVAALLFAFALYPFMSMSMDVDEGIGSTDKAITVWGLPIAGEDFTDIPVDVEIIVQSIPTDVSSIEIFMIENSKGCDATDGSIEDTRTLLQKDESEHPNQYHIIEDPVESQTYDVEMSVDPGIYCMQVVVNSEAGGGSFGGINVQANVDIYPTQLPLAIFAVMCLLMSGFAFIGAQKHGKFVKDLVEPKAEPSIEETVLAQTSESRITAGPSGPPTGPSGPPTGPSGPPTGPSGPPVAGPTSPPAQQDAEPVAEPVAEPEPVAEVEEPVAAAPSEDVYEDQGDGWYFRKFPDGTYDQQVYVIEEGAYVPYVDPDA